MVSRGQGSMEYLMTYGWAILIVMVVGVAMWRMGIFSISGSVAPTASGFEALKPLTASCDMKKNVWFPGWLEGFECEFVNAAGSTITVRNVDVTVNEKYCQHIFLDVLPVFDDEKSNYLVRFCATDTGPCDDPPGCWDHVLDVDCSTNFGNGKSVPVSSNQAFFVVMGTTQGVTFGPCYPVKSGQIYSVNVDITYDFTSSGTTITKHSFGVIRVPGS
jgi:hypothetical protein